MSGDVSGSATVFSLRRQRDSRSRVPGAAAAANKKIQLREREQAVGRY